MKAVLVGIQLPGVESEAVEASLAELQRLVNTLGFEVIGTLTQRRKSPSPSTVIGAGKLRELARWTGGSGQIPPVARTKSKAAQKADEAEEPDTDEELLIEGPAPTGRATHVIFDNELTPNQLSNLQRATDAEVLDRTGVIVEIFHRHAKTREARLQVEIARLNYLAPRIRVAGAGDRQGGGIGGKGIGETSHELDRRRIRDRVAELQAEIEVIRQDHGNRRAQRSENPRVALVGYTNAGKSSLMRALTGSEVLVADKLFATLDTTVRAMQPEYFPRILISDTVGFIKKLPHDLVASFRSTLDEAHDASLLFYVVDAADPGFRSQLEVTKTVLSEIQADDIPSRLVLNKIDCLTLAECRLLSIEFPDALQISAKDPTSVSYLKGIIRGFFEAKMEQAEFLVPYQDQSGFLGEIRDHAVVLKEDFEETGVRLTVKTYADQLARLQKKFSSVGR